jgi:hypothetical protein
MTTAAASTSAQSQADALERRRLGHPVGVRRRQVVEDVGVDEHRGQGLQRGGTGGAGGSL